MENLFAFLGFCGFVLIIVWMVALLSHVSHMHDTLDRIAEKLGAEEKDPVGAEQKAVLRGLLSRGLREDALEFYHDLTGAGPEETEAAIRELEGSDAESPHEPPENRP